MITLLKTCIEKKGLLLLRPSPAGQAPAGRWPSPTDLAVAVAVQQVVADVGLQDGLPLLSGM